MHYLGDLVPESSRLRLASAFCKIGGLSGMCGMWVWAVISLVHSYREHSSARFGMLLRQSVGVRFAVEWKEAHKVWQALT